MSETAAQLIQASLDNVSLAVEEFPYYMPVQKAAELLHIKPEALRTSIEQGRCPFGFCWRLGDRTAYKIPTLTFCSWLLGKAVPV